MAGQVTLVWFRRDLRLHDNPALTAACERGTAVPVYIHAPEEEAPWAPGGAANWWLHHSLEALQRGLSKHRSLLVIRKGDSLKSLKDLIAETGATAVFWNRLYEPTTIPRDTAIKAALQEMGVEVKSFASALLHEPTMIRTQAGNPFQVFTPFWRHVMALDDPPEPLPPPRFRNPLSFPSSTPLEGLRLLPKIDWAAGMRAAWKVGEVGAQEQLERFLATAVGDYMETRNRPDVVGTSRLSPYLHFGEITPRTVWHAVKWKIRNAKSEGEKAAAWGYLREVGWREFAHHLLFHFPATTSEPLRKDFGAFPWKTDAKRTRAWQKGLTGYPIVDAGMRELWATGWMHNRVRMIVASFLVKDLLVDWRAGAEWFWDTLVDADLANNTSGWQWTAGCGADAAPYFRIFNPTSQAEKFDPQGVYIRQWVPEIAALPDKYLFAPWTAPADLLSELGITLGRTYPKPIVDHSVARDRALEAYARIRN